LIASLASGWAKGITIDSAGNLLVSTFRTIFQSEFTYEGNRAIVFETATKVPADALAFCIAAALTYHAQKKSRR